MGLIKSALEAFGPLDRIHAEAVPIDVPFVEIAARFADLPGTVALLSGGDLDSARFHLLAVNPWMTVKSHGSGLHVELAGKNHQETGNPFDLLKELLRTFRMEGADFPAPVAAGLFGYLSYDLKDFIETLPRTAVDDLGLPQTCLYAPSAILIQNKQSGEATLCLPVSRKRGEAGLQIDRDAFYERFDAPKKADSTFVGRTSGFRSVFTRRTYMAAVEKIKEYIVSGDIYQANLSQRFDTAFAGDPFAFFRAMYESAPAPFYAYVHAGDHRIISTSPERFLLQRGRRVETRPIKGTRPRGKTPAEDRAFAEALENSGKDDAELSMIVDLMRNDLGRVCEGGSVKVTAHKRLEPYRNVFHLVSTIEGLLSDDFDSIDLIRAAFPGGSITGCPRIRAMEIIDELEPYRRHIYTGSIGYIGFNDTMDLSIAIRTAAITQDRMYVSVGGGVVYDSDPADEFDETLHKGRTIMGAFEQVPETAPEPYVWFNGLIVPAADARIPVTDPGIQYGWGIFETIRVDRVVPAFLEAHLERFKKSWIALFGTAEPDLTWKTVIEQVIAANRLEDRLARVKILATPGGAGHPNLVVTAAPYVHRLEQSGKTGLELATYPCPRQTPLADHKTTNYLYYALANRWAVENGADEAVIANPDGSLSETATGNLLFLDGKQVIRPASAHVLPGIMEGQVTGFLAGKGYEVRQRRVMPGDLSKFEGILMTNSLVGAVAVLRIDNTPVQTIPFLCDRINDAVLITAFR